jgi:hypothetical protein
MQDLSWKFYFINAAWDFVFLVLAYFTFVETKGLKLEEINAKFEGTRVTIAGIADDSSTEEVVVEADKQDGIATKSQEMR